MEIILVAGLDDVFVRRDLFDGKYAPDLEKQKQFELETNGNRRWDAGIRPESNNVKLEL